VTRKQTAAARLIGRGHSQVEAAGSVGVSPRTIRRWSKEPAFVAADAQADIGEPTALETLRTALGATRANGQPDWPTRVSAARALLAAPPEREATTDREVVVRIYDAA
jgi:hypothetical protein